MQANAHTHARTHTYMFMYVLFQTHRQDVMFTGTLTAQDQVNQWIQDKCVPLVREITFENAEVRTLLYN